MSLLVKLYIFRLLYFICENSKFILYEFEIWFYLFMMYLIKRKIKSIYHLTYQINIEKLYSYLLSIPICMYSYYNSRKINNLEIWGILTDDSTMRFDCQES